MKIIDRILAKLGLKPNRKPEGGYFLEQQAINKMNARLNLPATGEEQDWELELSDKERVSEFLEFFWTGQLNDDEKRALFALIMSSLSDKREANLDVSEEEAKVGYIIANYRDLLTDIIDYWNWFEQEL